MPKKCEIAAEFQCPLLQCERQFKRFPATPHSQILRGKECGFHEYKWLLPETQRRLLLPAPHRKRPCRAKTKAGCIGKAAARIVLVTR